MKRIIIVLAGFLFLAPLTLAGVAQATAPSGVTSTTLGRISLGPYHQTSAGFKLFAKEPTDTVRHQHAHKTSAPFPRPLSLPPDKRGISAALIGREWPGR